MNIGLSNKNIFFENINKFYSKNNKNLFNFILPELNPNDRNAINSLSTIYHHLGKKNEAVKYNNKADGVIVFHDDEEEYQII